MKRKIIITAIFLIAAIALFFGYQSNRNFLKHYPRVQASIVTRSDLVDDIEVSGVVNSEDIRDLYLNSSTKIRTLLVKEGDSVRVGQILAILDIDAKKIEIAQCRNNIIRLEQELDRKRLEGYSPVGLEITRADLKTEYSRRDLLQKELQELTVTAPVAGRISLLTLKTGETVTPGIRFGQIINDEKLTIEAETPAEDAIKINRGDSAEIRVASIRRPYSAKVIQILPPVKKPDNNFSNPRIKLLIQPGANLIPGTIVRVRVRIARAKLVVTVPIEAIHEETVTWRGDRDYFAVRPFSGKIRKYVYILKDCSETLGLNQEQEKSWLIRDNVYQARKIYVETGISSVNQVEIIKGLKPFEQVVIYTDRMIRDYGRVIVINRDESYKQPITAGNGG